MKIFRYNPNQMPGSSLSGAAIKKLKRLSSPEEMEKQHTIAREIAIFGYNPSNINKTLKIILKPADEGSGIIFSYGSKKFKPRLDGSSTFLHQIAARNGFSHFIISEHFMGLIYGLGIDNLEINFPDRVFNHLPLFSFPVPSDSRYTAFIEHILDTGIINQNVNREYFEPSGEKNFIYKDAAYNFMPWLQHSLQIESHVYYPEFEKFAPAQSASVEISPLEFAIHLADARAYSSLERSAILHTFFPENAFLKTTFFVDSPTESRFIQGETSFELVLHKMLDLAGSLFLLGKKLRGKLTAGFHYHAADLAFLKFLLRNDNS